MKKYHELKHFTSCIHYCLFAWFVLNQVAFILQYLIIKRHRNKPGNNLHHPPSPIPNFHYSFGKSYSKFQEKAAFQFTENLFSKALPGCWDRRSEDWCQNACRENILLLQYLPDSIRTIFIKAAAAPDDALRSHGFMETEINCQFDISQLYCKLSLCRVL